jgi:predicted methyltransferase
MTLAVTLSRLVLAAAFACITLASAQAADRKLQAAIASPVRSAKNVARDQARHPYETLHFVGVRPNQTVLEILPGGGYWSEILVPYLQAHGHYIATIPEAGDLPEQIHERVTFQQFQAADPARYGKIEVLDFTAPFALAKPNSVDVILTFRNLHNWMKRGTQDAILASFYRSLKPGGILGIEDHRGRTDKPQDPQANDGYVREDYAIALIEKAGFKLVAKSQIGANPKDTKDYPAGVWTLPPVLKLGDKDRARYVAIGESDRFTLKFVKPKP